eukprot:TRINITY_DN5017_c0_g2_i2.p1 TRINITY_DN5017_c0_g2~~TRINITY_DN5017_c0_g2_i2.p1  ORF type:complete len:442 (+),score=90.97 TRINITY_DN5017_c0_g2_i2:64-1389(+)
MAGGRTQSVCIIGGGCAGTCAARYLRQRGHRVTVLEAHPDSVGGIWNNRPTNPVVYDSLVTNLPKQVMQSFDLPFPDSAPTYLRPRHVGAYVAEYADRFRVRECVRYGSVVTSVSPLRSEVEEAAGDSAWRVEWKRAGGPPAAEEFNAVVVCNGHYEEPFLPSVPGAEEWLAASGRRTLQHACTYREPSRFRGRVVLVVGGRSSGADISREAAGVCDTLYVSAQGFREEPSWDRHCCRLPAGVRIRSDGRLVLPGGEVVAGPPVDDVVLATGYLFSFPFLDEKALGMQVGRWVRPLHLHMFHTARPSLSFVGIPLAVPAPIPLFEAQARLLASFLSGDVSCRETHLSQADRRQWVANRLEYCGSRPHDFHFLGDTAWDYMRDLARRAGDMRDAELDAYLHRVAAVERLYQDRVTKQPPRPWSNDWYRRGCGLRRLDRQRAL